THRRDVAAAPFRADGRRRAAPPPRDDAIGDPSELPGEMLWPGESRRSGLHVSRAREGRHEDVTSLAPADAHSTCGIRPSPAGTAILSNTALMPSGSRRPGSALGFSHT